MTLLLSVVALLLGPLLYALGQQRLTARQFLDGFVFITIAGIVCVHIVPETLAVGGALAIVFLLAGLAFPVVLERVFEAAMQQAHSFILLIAAVGLVVHVMLDGIALAADGAATALAWGVILHRVPIGMAVWWSLRPQFGAPVAVATFAIIVIGTAVSYQFAAPLLTLAATDSVAYFQSFVAGSLVHVVAFGRSHDHGHAGEPTSSIKAWGYRLGILAGLFLLFALPHGHD